MGGPSSSGSFQGFGTAAVNAKVPRGKGAGSAGPAAAGGSGGSVKQEQMPVEAGDGGNSHHSIKAEGGEAETAAGVSPPPQMDETGGLELHDHDLVGLPEDITGVLGEQDGDIWDVLVDPDGGTCARVRSGKKSCRLSIAVVLEGTVSNVIVRAMT
jgi:hypothetical protein